MSDVSSNPEEDLVSSTIADESDASYESDESEASRSSESSIPADAYFKRDLQHCLDHVHHDGTFFAFYHSSTYINPGLDIADYRPVGLPLASRDAEALARICKHSPFGKGAETIIDTSVRKTWELDCAAFDCRNPAWASYLAGLSKRAVDALGVQVSCRAKRYKLLLYEEGAFFNPHQDSEKVPSMFGTLIVCLPSEHSGGQVRLIHGGKERVLETAPTSSFDISTLAWYSDVQHEVNPILSGYRQVLTYNLVQDERKLLQTAAALDASHYRLERLLRIWELKFDYHQMFVYPLEHQYTEASLSLKALKGSDAAKGRYLDQLCSKNGVYWFLGRVTLETIDYDNNEGEEVLSHVFDYIVTPSGVGMDLSLHVDEDQILGDAIYADRGADSEEEGGYTGNEGSTPIYRYHDTVSILDSCEDRRLTGGRSSFFCEKKG